MWRMPLVCGSATAGSLSLSLCLDVIAMEFVEGHSVGRSAPVTDLPAASDPVLTTNRRGPVKVGTIFVVALTVDVPVVVTTLVAGRQ